jgi:pyroglutamyl-peptidase
VFTKAEIKQAWGKSPARLDSLLDFDAVIAGWKARTSNSVDVRASDDVGNYVCGFAYYLSLAKVVQTKGKGRVVFLHVPPLEGEREIEKGVEVTIALIKAIVETL